MRLSQTGHTTTTGTGTASATGSGSTGSGTSTGIMGGAVMSTTAFSITRPHPSHPSHYSQHFHYSHASAQASLEGLGELLSLTEKEMAALNDR